MVRPVACEEILHETVLPIRVDPRCSADSRDAELLDNTEYIRGLDMVRISRGGFQNSYAFFKLY